MRARTTRLNTLATTTDATPPPAQPPEQPFEKPQDKPIEQAKNQAILTASIAEVEPLRYTPAGLPALNLRLEHASEILEAGQLRQVKLVVKAVAFGALAERLVKQPIGGVWRFNGFLATPRNGKSVVFHVQELSQD